MHLMKMAARYDSYLADRIKEDPILGTLTARKEKFALARDFLTDASLTGFFFVLNAEKLSILETARAVDLLVKHGKLFPYLIYVHCSPVFCNATRNGRKPRVRRANGV